jgi:hypothetical protein
MSKEFKHHYEIIEFKLKKYLNNYSDCVVRSNPSCIQRRDFANKLFEDKLPVRVEIGENCHHLVADLMYCKQGIDGAKNKDLYTDPDTKEKYQKYGHLGDTFEYLIVELLKTYFYD